MQQLHMEETLFHTLSVYVVKRKYTATIHNWKMAIHYFDRENDITFHKENFANRHIMNLHDQLLMYHKKFANVYNANLCVYWL